MAIADNLMAFWELEEASGDRADSKGSNTLSVGNSCGREVGKVGYAALFTSALSEYLYCATNAALEMGDIDFTIAGWFNNYAGGWPGLVLKSNGAGNEDYKIAIDYANYAVVANFNGADGISVTSANNSASSWSYHYFVVWHDAANDLLGVSVDNATPVTQATGGLAPEVSSARFQISGDQGGSANYCNGPIDQVGLWKRVLTSDERTWLYNSGNGRAYSEFGSSNQLTVNVYESTIVDEFNG